MNSILKKSPGIIIGLALTISMAFAQTIVGPTSVSVGTQYGYSYDDGTVYVGATSWLATGGTVISSSISGSTYSAVIQWTTSGPGNLDFRKKGPTLVASLAVSICGAAIYDIGGGGGYCNGSSGVTVTLSGSQVGINYQIFVSGTARGSAVAGTGGALSIVNQTWTGNYTIVGTEVSTGCTRTMNSNVNVFVLTSPTSFTMTGGGSYCIGSAAPSVQLLGSQTGVNYQLRVNGTNTGSPVAGTNSTLTWTNQTASGTYSVLATNTTTGCTNAMPSTTTVTANAVLTVYTVGGGGTYCSGSTAPSVTLSGSQSGVNYQLIISGSNSGSPVAGTGGVLTWTNQFTGGTYTISATNASTGCNAAMSGSASVTVNALPQVFDVGGGGNYCSGGSGSSVTLSGSRTGVNYQLKVNGSNVGSPVAGSSITVLTWTNQTTTGTYTITGTTVATGCSVNMNGSVAVGINPLPAVFTVGGGGSYCSGGSGVSVTLPGTMEAGVNYELYYNGGATGSIFDGTGAHNLSWANRTAAGTYTVKATNVATGCNQFMTGSTTVSINPLPTLFSMGGGGSYCSGGAGVSVTLSGSQTGVNYQLKAGVTNSGSPVAGTGGVLTWTNQTTAGSYTVVATNATTSCVQTMTGTATVSINSLPTLFSVTGGGSYCSGATGVSVTLSGSQTGINYQLKAGVTNSGSAVAGTGGVLTWTNQTTAGSYTVVATNATTSCIQTMTGSPTVTINPLPTLFSVTGGGSYCAGATGVSITLSGSQTGVNYQLKAGVTNSGSPVAGTGGVLTWTNQTTAGSYTVVATNATTACMQTMTGSPTVTINPLPTSFSVTGGGSYCAGGAGVSITLSGSQTGINYQLKAGGIDSGSAIAGTGGVLTWTNQTTAGSYTVVATNATTSCLLTMTGTATVSINPLPTLFTVGGGGSYCAGGTGVSITLTGSQTGVNYQLKINGTDSGSAIAGTGSALTWTNQTTIGTYTVVATNATTTCIQTMTGNASVSTVTLPIATISGSTLLVYGNPTTLSTGSYYSYQWKKNGVNISGATLQNFVADGAGNITVATRTASGAIECESPPATLTSTFNSQPTSLNMVSSTTILKAGVSDYTSLYTLQPNEVNQVIAYQDGIGRTFQTIGVGLAPNHGDIVTVAGFGKHGLNETSYMPYTTSTADGRYQPNALRDPSDSYTLSEQYKFYQNASLVAHDAYPYAKTNFRDEPGARAIETGAPGADWQLGATPLSGLHTVRSVMAVNNASYPVRYWKADGTTTGNYPANSVVVSITTDENGNQVRTYTNLLGQTVLKQVQLDETINSVTVNWLDTYYIYDNNGRLAYQVPPLASKTFSGASANVTTVSELIYQYTYDVRGRLVEKKDPGTTPQYIIYDNLDRVVLTQDANQRGSNSWQFIKYDYLSRPVYTGLYRNDTQVTRPTVQALFDAIDLSVSPRFETEQINTTTQGYTNTVYPTTGTVALTILNVYYYDHYNFDRDALNTADYSYDNTHLAGLPTAASTATRGMPTGSRKKTVNEINAISSTWLTSVVFYDNFDRPLQTLSNNYLNANLQDKGSVLYDFAGHVLKTMTTHSTAAATVNVMQRYTYDAAWRTVGIYHTIDNNAEQQLAGYTYNALGQVVDKKLHVNGSAFLQSVDYRYNIRGWLASINNAQLKVDNGATNDDTNDYFGMELAYNTGMATNKAYNGNITSLLWKGPGKSGIKDQRSYQYTYDKSDKLKAAVFQANDTTANWLSQVGTLNESLTYDHNGNILTLLRQYNQRSVGGTNNAQAIDNLTYTYANNANKLNKVEDAVPVATGTGDFKNGNVTTTDYQYQSSGSLKSDLNKGISQIDYNVLGKPRLITYSGTPVKTIKYTYDAAGTKIKMVTDDGTTVTTTDYVGGFVYTNNVLSFFSSPEGRVVKNGSNYEYQYAIADHQGNTRVLFTSATPAAQSVSTDMEAATNSNFTNYTNLISFDLMDHTDAGTTYTYAQKLTGASNSQIGVAKSYTVFAGDKVKIEGYAKYFNPQVTASNLSGFAAALTGAFGVTSTSTGELLKAYNALNNAGSIVAAGGGNNSGSGYPKLFVNILLFDRNYNLVDASWQQIDGGEQPVGNGTKLPHDYMSAEMTAKEAGYAYVYFSNESASLVEFYIDDVTMTYTPSNVIQYNEFYNHGMPNANSWTKPNNTGNNFLANGGTELNATSQLYDLDYRNYDPVLGRMNGVDPMASKYSSHSPYSFAFNDPITFNDPSGADPDKTHYFSPQIEDNGVFGASNSTGSLFDQTWGGGFSGIGGIGLGSVYQQMNIDARNLSAQEYGEKYGEEIYNCSDPQKDPSNRQFGAFYYTVSSMYGTSVHLNLDDIDAYVLRGFDQQTQTRPNQFHFFPAADERQAVEYMMLSQELYEKELSAYLVHGEKGYGVLVLPWSGNTRTSANRWIRYSPSNKTITDYDNNIYKVLLNLHTHPDDGPGDIPWRPSDDDILNTRDQGIPGVILAPNNYILINTNLGPAGHMLNAPANGGATRDLIKGYDSLFRFIK